MHVDNKLRYYGDTDTNKKRIRINKSKSKRTRELGDSILHEQLHAEHPLMHERHIQRLATKRWGSLSRKQKSKLYNLTK